METLSMQQSVYGRVSYKQDQILKYSNKGLK